ncbi:MAG: ATP-binding protein [Flaviaesturariibacter sp.]|nr:ATP-binding protein [Flaviaesturariibacter sp.]
MAEIIGRREEKAVLQSAVASKEAELVAIYGRRRIGKTYLIRNYYEDRIAFELTGMNNGSLKAQLLQFSKALQQATRSPLALTPPQSWVSAFTALEQVLGKASKKKKWVLFFDEFPWLNSRKSGFLEAFDHFWNTWASRQPNLIVVICGSAASWMINNVVNAKGGLHNRITRSIRLLPFSLSETKAYINSLSVNLDHYQILQLYMAFGGVPHYLRNVERGRSATQLINKICFTGTGALRDEFTNLYQSLFESAGNHIKTVKALSKTPKGLTRQEIIDVCGFSSGGGTSDMLNELEQSGFILSAIPYNKTFRESIYRLTDEFSLFYLRFMDGVKITGNDMWSLLSTTNTYKVWCGMSFEAICLKHIPQIKQALSIGGVHSEESPWRYGGTKGESGAQIDLLIDRADRTVNICEMKFYTSQFTIDKAYATELERKLQVFQEQTKTKKSLFLTFLTTYGVKKNEYAARLIHNELTMDIFFP